MKHTEWWLDTDETYSRETADGEEMIVTSKWRFVAKVIYDLLGRMVTHTHKLSTWQKLNVGDVLYWEYADNDIQLREDGFKKDKEKLRTKDRNRHNKQ